MENRKITKFMKNPPKMYIGISPADLDEFFSTGYAKISKEKCKTAYTMYDFKQGILEANHIAVKDEHRHTVDLMMFALGQIEDLQNALRDLESALNQLARENEQLENETAKEEQVKKTQTKENNKETINKE